MGKVIAVASGKGGTGKTTSVAAISSCLAVLGFKTLCIDFDAGLKNLDLSLCMTDFTVTDYMDVVRGRMDLKEACSESPQIPGLYFLTAPTVSEMEEPDEAAIRSLFDEARKNFDYCLIDLPSGIGTGFKHAVACADTVIIVITGELPAIRDAQRAAAIVRELGCRDLRLLVNRVLPKNLKLIRINIDDVIDSVGARLIGIVPEDNSIFKALHMNAPLILYKKKLASYDFLDVARRISGDEVPLRQW